MDQCNHEIKAETRPAQLDWDRLVSIIRSAERICLTTHIRPDCDAVGSELTTACALRQIGKQVKIVNPFVVPYPLRFLVGDNRLLYLEEPEAEDWLESIDLLMILDTSAWAQLGAMGDVIRRTHAKKIVLDHHATADDLGAEMFRDPSAEATGRLVLQLVERLGAKVTPEMARLLFAAVATDTGWFRFTSTSAKTYELAAKLAQLGAVPHEIYRAIYEQETLSRLRLMGRAMAKANVELDGRLIYSWLDREDFRMTGAQPTDSEDIINMILVVGGTQVAVMFIQLQQGGYKVSFRSRCHVDCSKVAKIFGGGGHRNAAGALIDEPFHVVKAKVLEAVRAALAEG